MCITPQAHLGACAYAFPYNVTVDGMYHLRARAVRESFAALDESNPRPRPDRVRNQNANRQQEARDLPPV